MSASSVVCPQNWPNFWTSPSVRTYFMDGPLPQVIRGHLLSTSIPGGSKIGWTISTENVGERGWGCLKSGKSCGKILRTYLLEGPSNFNMILHVVTLITKVVTNIILGSKGPKGLWIPVTLEGLPRGRSLKGDSRQNPEFDSRQ